MPYPDFGRQPSWHASSAVLPKTEPKPAIGPGFTGKTVLITGGATGVGRAAAIEFARLGANVAFCFVDMPGRDVRETALLTETTVAAMGVKVYADSCDVRNRDAVAAFVSTTVERLGGVHYLVNNAGIANDGALWRLSNSAWEDVIFTNLVGAFNCIAVVAPIFRGQRYGKIVNVSSHQATRPGFGVTSFAASKAGLEGLTRAVAVELGPSSVNVNAVAPGFVRTERLSELPRDVIERARSSTVLGRLAEPQDIAHVITFLCSDEARHVTGQVILVDGGLSLEHR